MMGILVPIDRPDLELVPLQRMLLPRPVENQGRGTAGVGYVFCHCTIIDLFLSATCLFIRLSLVEFFGFISAAVLVKS